MKDTAPKDRGPKTFDLSERRLPGSYGRGNNPIIAQWAVGISGSLQTIG